MKYLSLSLVGLTAIAGAIVLSPKADAQAMEMMVPYVSQVPDGAWVAPWNEACEEASITMINGFYQKKKAIPIKTSKQDMQNIIDWEKTTLNNYQDTTAEETKRVADQFGVFTTEIKRNPSVEDIKQQLDAQHPVIALVNLYKFYNEKPAGDSYHVFVISGYNDVNKEFFVNDPGRSGKTASYDRLMTALHDYNPQSKEADGQPTVLFTAPKASTVGFFSSVIDFFRRLFA